MVQAIREGRLTTFLGHADVGVGFVGAAGLISACLTFGLLVYLLVPRVRRMISTDGVSQGVGQFVRDPLGWFMVNMLLCDLLQGAGFAINLHWAAESALWVGGVCTAQGAVTEVGDVGCAIFSLLISLQTFSVLFLRLTPPRWVPILAIVLSWALIVFLSLVGPLVIEKRTGKGTFYGGSGAWCWIGQKYQVERFFFLYFFIFFSVSVSWVCYTMLYVNTRRASRKVRRRSGQVNEKGIEVSGDEKAVEDDAIKAMSTRMLLYPILYSCVIIPVSISRLSVMNHTPVPLSFMMFSGVIFSSSGTVNVILWLVTRQSYIVREARRITYAVTTVVEISPPSDYVLVNIHEGSLGDTDARRAAKLDLESVALVHSPFEDGLTLDVRPRDGTRRRLGSWESDGTTMSNVDIRGGEKDG